MIQSTVESPFANTLVYVQAYKFLFTKFLSLINKVDILTAEYKTLLEMDLPIRKYILSVTSFTSTLIMVESIGRSPDSFTEPKTLFMISRLSTTAGSAFIPFIDQMDPGRSPSGSTDCPASGQTRNRPIISVLRRFTIIKHHFTGRSMNRGSTLLTRHGHDQPI
jgi:hypothetical protein